MIGGAMDKFNVLIDRLISRIEAPEYEIKREVYLSEISSFKIGGIADAIIYPFSTDALVDLIRELDEVDLPHIIIGKASNILFFDARHSEIVVCTTHLKDYKIFDKTLQCDAGASLATLGGALARAGLSGFEGLAGIPGTVGGAIYMNAGAFGCEISDTITSAKCYDKESGNIIELSREDMKLSYRKSVFSESDRYVILSAEFSLTARAPEEIMLNMKLNREKRQASQPLEYPSAGSVFKRPPNAAAGALIDQAGLKGLSVGGAEVSTKHAGFIVNRGDATASDVLELIKTIKEKVFDLNGIMLECEIELK